MDRLNEVIEKLVSVGIRSYVGLLSHGEQIRSSRLFKEVLGLSALVAGGPSAKVAPVFTNPRIGKLPTGFSSAAGNPGAAGPDSETDSSPEGAQSGGVCCSRDSACHGRAGCSGDGSGATGCRCDGLRNRDQGGISLASGQPLRACLILLSLRSILATLLVLKTTTYWQRLPELNELHLLCLEAGSCVGDPVPPDRVGAAGRTSGRTAGSLNAKNPYATDTVNGCRRNDAIPTIPELAQQPAGTGARSNQVNVPAG